MRRFLASLSPWQRSACLTALVFVVVLPLLGCWYLDTHKQRLPWQQAAAPIWPLPEDPAAARKARLINKLLPAIQENNQRLLATRLKLQPLHQQLQAGETLSQRQLDWLMELAQHQRLEPTDNPDSDWSRVLLRRVDIIPADLALAQGALESAWGESRFAREGNNYFGHWCFVPGCGLVPQSRSEGAHHEVARFSSADESVRRYMHNLNSHPSYAKLRLIREAARQRGAPFSGSELAAGLSGYSGLGDDYITMLRNLIRQNDFSRFANY